MAGSEKRGSVGVSVLPSSPAEAEITRLDALPHYSTTIPDHVGAAWKEDNRVRHLVGRTTFLLLNGGDRAGHARFVQDLRN